MAKPRIAIVGLGLIGASVGLALRKTQTQFEVIGHDKDMGASKRATRLGAVEKTEWNLISACEPADAIIIATPFSEVEETFKAISPYLKQGVVITDTTSTKQQVLKWAEEHLPPHANFVGGDPILAESVSKKEPSATLFEKAVYCLCPSPKASPQAVEFVSAIVTGFGAQPFFLDAVEHDGLVAGSEHLPLVAAAALLSATQNAASWHEMRKIAGTNYDAVVNLFAGDPKGSAAASLANASNVVAWIDTYIAKLQEIRDLLSDDDEEKLKEMFQAAWDHGEKWKAERARGVWDQNEGATHMTEQPNFVRQAFLGGGFKRKSPDDKKDKERKR